MSLYAKYDSQHRHPVNRALHMLAIPLGFSALIVVWFHWVIALLLIPMAFAIAWIGNMVEGNQPATVSHPAAILMAPLWMARRLFGMGTPPSS